MLPLEERIPCKLTDKYGYTKNQTLWGENITHEATGDANQPLCSDGWIHFYEHPLIAVFMNPTHAAFKNPILWTAKPEGKEKRDGELKSGCRRLTILRRIELPVITLEQRVEIGIRCAMTVYKNTAWLDWAQKWISGEDRTKKSATAATYAAAANAAANAAAEAANAAAEAAFAATRINTNSSLFQIIKEVLKLQ